jgi:hypothetical protein
MGRAPSIMQTSRVGAFSGQSPFGNATSKIPVSTTSVHFSGERPEKEKIKEIKKQISSYYLGWINAKKVASSTGKTPPTLESGADKLIEQLQQERLIPLPKNPWSSDAQRDFVHWLDENTPNLPNKILNAIFRY